MDSFAVCERVNTLLQEGNSYDARNELIRLLDYHHKNEMPYSPVMNHMIRETGLYAYLEPETASWSDRFVYESFKVDIGLEQAATLHGEQSVVLRHLLEGTDLAVSAPTSFGKSLIIDAFIAIKRPANVVILVPTIALTDETRRRLSRKFGTEYRVITTADADLSDKNILIFPQERALSYYEKLESIDLLVVDEFYKASKEFDKDRAPALLKAMLKLGEKAKQRYYLAPHVSKLPENPFTRGMLFLPLDFNTVFLQKHDFSAELGKDAAKKSSALVSILEGTHGKSLIYAGTYPNVERVANLLIEKTEEVESPLLTSFAEWLSLNYDPNWKLTTLVRRGAGIHTGQLHRSLSQIQVRLFEEPKGLRNLVSTSSIIEGVNTSAENVIVWSNKNGNFLLKDFTYRNIIGRGGRMFRHFVGNIFILEKPPAPTDTQLDLTFPDELLADIDDTKFKQELTKEQVAKIILFREQMKSALGPDALERLQREGSLITSDMALITDIAHEVLRNQSRWRAFGFLNSDDTENWGWILGKILKLSPGGWDCPHSTFVEFIKVLSNNWHLSIPELLDELDELQIGIEQFFRLERNATFKLSALINDINVIQKEILKERAIDASPFISALSKAFLPSCVLALEEYGLPRMLAKKLQEAKMIDFSGELKLHEALQQLRILRPRIQNELPNLHHFDRYVLDYFYEGIDVHHSGVK